MVVPGAGAVAWDVGTVEALNDRRVRRAQPVPAALEGVRRQIDRGRGIGGRMLDLMTATRGERRGLLGTSADERDPAVRLYRSRGWVGLGLLSDDVPVMGLAGSATKGPAGLRD